MKKDILITISILGCIIGCLSIVYGLFFSKILNLDVKAIPAEYDSESELLQYDGKTYHVIEMNDASYSHSSDLELLGRMKGSGMLLYCYKNDPDKSIIMGDALDIGYIFSDRYSTIPTDGEVTSVYLYLAELLQSEAGSHHPLVKNKYLKDVEEVELFNRLWKERYENAPIVFENSQILDESDYVWVRFCFEECPAPGANNELILYNGEWYLIETEYDYVNNQHIQTDYYYLIDDEEILDYLDEYIKYDDSFTGE